MQTLQSNSRAASCDAAMQLSHMAKDGKGLKCVEMFSTFIFEGRYPVIVSFITEVCCIT